jgi:hypothetical protein
MGCVTRVDAQDYQPGDIVVRLGSPEELLTSDPSRLLAGAGRLVSGADELVDRFLALRKRNVRHHRIVLDLAGPAEPGLAERLRQALYRYCDLRAERVERQLGVMWRDGMSTLLIGSLLFVIGVALSQEFVLDPEVDPFWKELFGNGVFLVVAWIGLWYPLDMLLIERRPAKRELRVVMEMKRLPFLVRTGRPEPDRGSG